ncbi:MAG TPA: hypothetical protein VFE62_26990, partial [Gemmataceae bacterium]|nr:hypothetical protein [Gemmataceae bacterium]
MSALIEEDLRTLGDPASGYRPISGFAIAGLLTGALSILALVHTAFLFIPIAAIGINWKALRSIHDLSPELAGRRLALAGLALALIFGLSAPALPFLKERADRYQSIQLASAWFTALRNGQTSLGLQCTLPKWMRVTEGVNPDAAYADLSGQKTLTRFAENPAVSALLELGKRAHVRYVGNVTMQIDEEKQTLV